MAGVQVTGAYDQGQFSLILEAWRRDLMVTLHGISGDGASFGDLFPAAKMEAAVRFATNAAPEAEGAAPVDMLKRFLGSEDASKQFCHVCDGRGKRGLIARTCNECGGTVVLPARRDGKFIPRDAGGAGRRAPALHTSARDGC